MTVSLVIAYEKGSNIDRDYFIKNHVPLVASAWEPYAKGWKVEAPTSGPNAAAADCPFELMVTVQWDSMADIIAARSAMAPEKEQAIQDDLAKCSSGKKAIFWPMEVTATG